MASLFKRPDRDKWYASFSVPGLGRPVRCTGTTCKRAAEQIVAAWEADASRKRALGIDAAAESLAEQRQRPLAEHLDEFLAYLGAKGTGAGTVDAAQNRIERILDEANAKGCEDLTPAAVLGAMQALRLPGKVTKKGLSNKTANHYVTAIKGFSRWLVKDHRIATDPLAGLASRFNVETDRRRVRRNLALDELERIIAAAELQPSVSVPRRYKDSAGTMRDSTVKMSAPYRAWAYRVASVTGLRAGELASLKPTSFNLDGDTPTVVVEAAYSKHRRRDTLPLPADIVPGLRAFLKDLKPAVPVFPLPAKKGALLLRADMEVARDRWLAEAKTASERRVREESDFLRHLDSAGRVADFHGLRVTFISRVAESGATLKQAMELARHSDPKLTMKTYARVGLANLGGVIDGMTTPGTAVPRRAESLRKSGTDDGHGQYETGIHPGIQTQHGKGRDGAKWGESHGPGDEIATSEKPLVFTSEIPDSLTQQGSSENAEGRTRTADLRVMNPAL
jgi:integrase